MANCVSKVSEKDAEKKKARARRFMEMFGSHVSAGFQTLGGVFLVLQTLKARKYKRKQL